MPYIFIDDGEPESEEYETNYVWYDPADPASLERIKQQLGEEQLLKHAFTC
ncbi:MAG: hypothetical protein ACI9TH_000009 [Kiritimatiellia bacterium]|jgi:hypothetical protein